MPKSVDEMDLAVNMQRVKAALLDTIAERPKEASIKVPFRLSPAEYEKLRLHCMQQRISMNKCARAALASIIGGE